MDDGIDVTISVPELSALVGAVLRTRFAAADAATMADVVMFAELSGVLSHGIARVADGRYETLGSEPTGPPETQPVSPYSSVIVGNENPGILIAALAMQETLRILDAHPVAIVGSRGTISTSGSLAYFVDHIASRGFVAVMLARTDPFVAPPGADGALVGTNPLAIGIPSQPSPFVFDMSTAAIPFGVIRRNLAVGKPLPEGAAVDGDGRPTIDPAAALGGFVLPFDRSHKGWGLALSIEMLAGVLVGAGFGHSAPEAGAGNLIIAFDPALLGDPQQFVQRMGELISSLGSETTDYRVPGMRSRRTREQALVSGVVEADAREVQRLRNLVTACD